MNRSTKSLTALAVGCLAAWCAVAGIERPTVTFYVSPRGNDAAKGTKTSPVKTIQQAVNLARGVMSDAKREVIVGDGEYEIAEPIRIGADDCDLTIRAQHPGKAVVTGKVRLKGWTRDPEDKRFFVAKLPFEPEFGMTYALTCNGEDRAIAAWPEKGRMKYESVVDQRVISYPTNAFPKGADLNELDLQSVWLELPQEWDTTRTLIATNDVAARRFSLKKKAAISFKTFNHGFVMLNARLGLTQPGQWMYEAAKHRVVYWPKDGERPSAADIRLTRAKSVFACKSARGVTIRGLVLEGNASSFVSTNPYDANAPLAAVILSGNCEDCTLEDCEIRHSASAGVHAVKPERCLVKDCHIHDIGGNGIRFFDGGSRSEVIGCDVHDYGKANVAANGVAMQGSKVRCIGNHIHHGPGVGVTMWTPRSVLASNEIDHVMQKARDGGGLYGGQVYCRIHDNYVHDIGWPGLYNDEGGRDSIYYNNRFENCSWPIHMHCTRQNVVSNNVFKYDKWMHLSFQGSGDCKFVDNKLYGPASMTNAVVVTKYVPNCAEWARNEVFDLQKDGSYVNRGLVTLVAGPVEDTGGPIVLPRTVVKDGKPLPPVIDGKWPGEYMIKWKKVRGFRFFEDGRLAKGAQPSCNLRQCADDDYVYLHCHQLYARLGSYPGLINHNHVWGKSDGVRVYLGEKLEITMFFDGTIESNDPSLVFGKDDFAADKGGWYSGSGVEVRIPLKVIDGGRGKTVKFNAVNYNECTQTYRWMFVPANGNVRTGTLEFPAEDIMELK